MKSQAVLSEQIVPSALPLPDRHRPPEARRALEPSTEALARAHGRRLKRHAGLTWLLSTVAVGLATLSTVSVLSMVSLGALAGVLAPHLWRRRTERRAAGELAAAREVQRAAILAGLAPAHRDEAENLEFCVESVRSRALCTGDLDGGRLVAQLEELLTRYLEVAAEHRRLDVSLRALVARSPLAASAEGNPRMQALTAMRRSARERCYEDLARADAMLATLSQLIRLAYERSLASQLPLHDIERSIEQGLEELELADEVSGEIRSALAA